MSATNHTVGLSEATAIASAPSSHPIEDATQTEGGPSPRGLKVGQRVSTASQPTRRWRRLSARSDGAMAHRNPNQTARCYSNGMNGG